MPENRPSAQALFTELREAIKQTRRDGSMAWAIRVADALASRLEEAERDKMGAEYNEGLVLADLHEATERIAALEAERDALRRRLVRYESALRLISHAATYDGRLCPDIDDCPNCTAQAALRAEDGK